MSDIDHTFTCTFFVAAEGNQPAARDEIKEYLDGRYVSACEAFWRTFEFSMHDMEPAVYPLAVHLPNEQQARFPADATREELAELVSSQSWPWLPRPPPPILSLSLLSPFLVGGWRAS